MPLIIKIPRLWIANIQIPDGTTADPNNIKTWLACCGIIDKKCNTIDQVIEDTTTLNLLLNDENSMNYLNRSTDFAIDICKSETAMSYLGESNYTKNLLLNNDTWIEKINASSYWDLVYPEITIYSAINSTITINGKSFVSNSNGITTHAMPYGTFTISCSTSGYSFEKTISKETNELYVMPDGKVLYWYGCLITEGNKHVVNKGYVKINSDGSAIAQTQYGGVGNSVQIDGLFDISDYSKAYLEVITTTSNQDAYYFQSIYDEYPFDSYNRVNHIVVKNDGIHTTKYRRQFDISSDNGERSVFVQDHMQSNWTTRFYSLWLT